MRNPRTPTGAPIRLVPGLTAAELASCKRFIARETRPGGCIKVAPFLLRTDNAIDEAVKNKRNRPLPCTNEKRKSSPMIAPLQTRQGPPAIAAGVELRTSEAPFSAAYGSEDDIVTELKLPVPVKELAAVTDALCKTHGKGNLFMRQVGPMLQLYKPRKANPKL